MNDSGPAPCDDTLTALLGGLATLADELDEPDLASTLRRTQARWRDGEWLLLLLGATSAGKSTWLNTLLGESLLPATLDPSTAAVVEVRFTDLSEPRFSVVPRGASEARNLSRAEFVRLTAEGADLSRLRVDWPLARVEEGLRGVLAGCVIVDAPGYDACVDGHEDILDDVVPEADAVLCLYNFRSPFTAKDGQFLESVASRAREGALAFGVNRAPVGGGSGARLGEFRRAIAGVTGAEPQVRVLDRCEDLGGVRIWSAELWADLVRILGCPSRVERLRGHHLDLAGDVLAILRAQLDDRLRVHACPPADLLRVRTLIAALERAESAAPTVLAEFTVRAERRIADEIAGTRASLWAECDRHIAEANAWTDMNTVRAFLAEQLVPLRLEAAGKRIENGLRDDVEALASAIDTLRAEIGELPPPPVRLPGIPAEHTRDALARAVMFPLAQALVRFGGRFGRLAGSAAAVVAEAVAYAYAVARWKPRLRGLLQRLLGLEALCEPWEERAWRSLESRRDRLPLHELGQEARAVALEAADVTRDAVGRAFARRRAVLEAALRARSEGPEREGRCLLGWAARVSECQSTLASLRAGGHDE